MTSWSSSIKICFYTLIESIIKKICHGVTECKKNMPLVKQNVMKLEAFILENKEGMGERENQLAAW